jgi:hypothetical protein
MIIAVVVFVAVAAAAKQTHIGGDIEGTAALEEGGARASESQSEAEAEGEGEGEASEGGGRGVSASASAGSDA